VRYTCIWRWEKEHHFVEIFPGFASVSLSQEYKEYEDVRIVKIVSRSKYCQ